MDGLVGDGAEALGAAVIVLLHLHGLLARHNATKQGESLSLSLCVRVR
jgi:hypothetical protein